MNVLFLFSLSASPAFSVFHRVCVSLTLPVTPEVLAPSAQGLSRTHLVTLWPVADGVWDNHEGYAWAWGVKMWPLSSVQKRTLEFLIHSLTGQVDQKEEIRKEPPEPLHLHGRGSPTQGTRLAPYQVFSSSEAIRFAFGLLVFPPTASSEY